jgi:diaminohydroxyphosphoribosylaminopyrimidine deaminase/5-amino-6-(5-phosphoribosylamino)uracil reductase
VKDETYMRAALREARKAIGRTSPNPAVGAVLVKRGKIIARGWTQPVGLPHAEIEALRKTSTAKGATLYVTLEPCSTTGRTPPCTKAIIAAGIARVVIGAVDPNPAHAGRAKRILQRAGIEVSVGLLAEECAALNRAFNKWIVSDLPWVIAKAGMSLDGRITRPPGEGQWITSPASRADAQRLRARVDAILIGAATLRADNPRLTVRDARGAGRVQPWRVVLTRSGELPASAHVFTDAHKARTLVFRNKSLRAVLRALGKKEITSVLIEGGGDVLGQAFDGRLVDEAHFYIAPLLTGGPKAAVAAKGAGSNAQAARIKNPRYRRIGDDLHVSGEVEY